MKNYLSDLPSLSLPVKSDFVQLIIIYALSATVAFVHGPQGSGKTRMLKTVLQETER